MGVLGYMNEDTRDVQLAGEEYISTHGPGVPTSSSPTEPQGSRWPLLTADPTDRARLAAAARRVASRQASVRLPTDVRRGPSPPPARGRRRCPSPRPDAHSLGRRCPVLERPRRSGT